MIQIEHTDEEKAYLKEYREDIYNDIYKKIAELGSELTLGKFKPLGELEEILEEERQDGKIVVVSSGAFLLPHYAHKLYLEKAKNLGNILVVSMNTDDSIRENDRCTKFVPLYGRIIEIASAQVVDYICMFNETTPITILDYLRPSIYTKGVDWEGKPLPEEEVIKKNKGKIVFIDTKEDFSSTTLAGNVKKHDKLKCSHTKSEGPIEIVSLD